MYHMIISNMKFQHLTKTNKLPQKIIIVLIIIKNSPIPLHPQDPKIVPTLQFHDTLIFKTLTWNSIIQVNTTC